MQLKFFLNYPHQYVKFCNQVAMPNVPIIFYRFATPFYAVRRILLAAVLFAAARASCWAAQAVGTSYKKVGVAYAVLARVAHNVLHTN
jgi:hypothetical protein